MKSRPRFELHAFRLPTHRWEALPDAPADTTVSVDPNAREELSPKSWPSRGRSSRCSVDARPAARASRTLDAIRCFGPASWLLPLSQTLVLRDSPPEYWSERRSLRAAVVSD